MRDEIAQRIDGSRTDRDDEGVASALLRKPANINEG
jgi:hypothetical protein